MKSREKTGLFYTDGTPICDSDTAVFWHTQESSRKLAPFERKILWDDDSAAFLTYDAKGVGYSDYLAESVNDVNCVKITKIK